MKNHKYKSSRSTTTRISPRTSKRAGTPHFFINGRRLVGAQPFEKFEKHHRRRDQARAGRSSAKGVKPAELYDALVKDGKGPAALEKKDVALSPASPAKGNMNAKVVIQEFSDFQCPFCKRVEDRSKQVMKDYGDKVKFVWRNMPPRCTRTHRSPRKPRWRRTSRKARRLLGDARQALRRPRRARRHQAPGAREARARARPRHDKFKNALDNSSRTKPRSTPTRRRAKTAGISGTPAFFINGYFIIGAQPYAEVPQAHREGTFGGEVTFFADESHTRGPECESAPGRRVFRPWRGISVGEARGAAPP